MVVRLYSALVATCKMLWLLKCIAHLVLWCSHGSFLFKGVVMLATPFFFSYTCCFVVESAWCGVMLAVFFFYLRLSDSSVWCYPLVVLCVCCCHLLCLCEEIPRLSATTYLKTSKKKKKKKKKKNWKGAADTLRGSLKISIRETETRKKKRKKKNETEKFFEPTQKKKTNWKEKSSGCELALTAN